MKYTLITMLALFAILPLQAQERDGKRGPEQRRERVQEKDVNATLEEQARTARQQARIAKAKAQEAETAAEAARAAARKAQVAADEAQAKLDATRPQRPNAPDRPKRRG